MVDNCTSTIGNNTIIDCIQGGCDRVNHSTMEEDVKIWIIYLLSFLLVINYPDTVVKDPTKTEA